MRKCLRCGQRSFWRGSPKLCLECRVSWRYNSATKKVVPLNRQPIEVAPCIKCQRPLFGVYATMCAECRKAWRRCSNCKEIKASAAFAGAYRECRACNNERGRKKGRCCLRCKAEMVGRGTQCLCNDCRPDWKWCNRCQRVLPREGFNFTGARSYPYCRECWSRPAEGQEQKDRSYQYHLRRKFSITKEEAAKLAAHKRCDICKAPRGKQRFHVDHCHRSGKIRGVLCRECNLALGHVEDRKRLAKIFRYLSAKESPP